MTQGDILHQVRKALIVLLLLPCGMLPPYRAEAQDLLGTGHVALTSGNYDVVYGEYHFDMGRVVIEGATLDMTGGSVQTLYGAQVATPLQGGHALGNVVRVSGGSVAGDIYGGSANSLRGQSYATSNVVLVSGTAQVHGVTGGFADDSGSYALASGNLVQVDGGTVTGLVSGGHALSLGFAEAEQNVVAVNGGTLRGTVMGGWSYSTRARALSRSNLLVVQGGSLNGAVVGGWASASSEGVRADALGNAVVLAGGSVTGTVMGGVYSGASGSAVRNAVTLQAGADVTGATLYGGAQTTADPAGQGLAFTPVANAGSGNMLNVLGWQGSVRKIAGFERLNMILPLGARSGDTIMTITGADSPLAGTTFTFYGGLGGSTLRAGDRFVLLQAAGADLLTLANDGQVRQVHHGFATLFDGTLACEGSDKLVLTVDAAGMRLNPQTRALTLQRVAELGLLQAGQDMVAGAGLRQAEAAARAAEGRWAAFAAVQGGAARYDAGEDTGWQGTQLMAGLARRWTGEAGSLTAGLFAEFLQAGTVTAHGALQSDFEGGGSARAAGGGVLAHWRQHAQGPAGVHAGVSLRAGELVSTWESEQHIGMLGTADYDARTGYRGGHAELGMEGSPVDGLLLDVYARYAYAHLDGTDVDIFHDSFALDALDSHRLRLGLRLDYALTACLHPYMDAAWEHEFAGTAHASLRDYDWSLSSSSLRGDSAVLGLGMAVTPASLPLRMDVGMEASAGVRDSLVGQARLVWEF